jgi:hypothetical protein
MKKLTSIAGIIVLFFSFSTAFASPVYYGEVTDPSGDSTNDDYCDLVYASLSVTATDITFSTRWAEGNFDRDLVNVVYFLDTDQNIETGLGSSAGDLTDGGVIGADYVAAYGPVNGVIALKEYEPDHGHFGDYVYLSNMDESDFHADGNGLDFTIPLAYLDNDEGLLDFQLRSRKLFEAGEGVYEEISDWAPNIGQPEASTTAAPVPGAAWLFGSGLIGLIYIRKRGRK